MYKNTRRDFMRLAGAAGAVSLTGLGGCTTVMGSGARVVVIGGGFGGATVARYIKRYDPSVSVTVIEPKGTYTTCPFSNAYLGGLRSIGSITHSYDGLRDAGVKVFHDKAVALDPAKQIVSTRGGLSLGYDRLVVSPGIDFRYDSIDGYDANVAQIMPHAWQAGPQSMILRKQLEAMDDGGVVIIASPPNPFRCPPGPYERASMIAHYLKTTKPRSKVLILDAKDKFSKQGAFTEGWKLNYGKMIEWVPASLGGKVLSVDAADRSVKTDFDHHHGAVTNVIPAQKAGAIAHAMGLTDNTGWCPVDLKSFESKLIRGVHVIGDAAIVAGMPKSGNAANTEAKQCAAAIAALLNGRSVPEPVTSNTCYSLVTPDYGISVTAVYHLGPEKYAGAKGSGGVSPGGRDATFRKQEARYAASWYDNITRDIWG